MISCSGEETATGLANQVSEVVRNYKREIINPRETIRPKNVSDEEIFSDPVTSSNAPLETKFAIDALN